MKTTNFEISKKLAEIGFKPVNENDSHWIYEGQERWQFPSFDLETLLDVLPNFITDTGEVEYKYKGGEGRELKYRGGELKYRGGEVKYKGAIECSANPNYPAAEIGDLYVVSVAGKIGGSSGKVVQVGDFIFCNNDNAGGTQASVGDDFEVIHALNDSENCLVIDVAFGEMYYEGNRSLFVTRIQENESLADVAGRLIIKLHEHNLINFNK